MHSGLVIKIKYGPSYFRTKLDITAQCAFGAGGAQLYYILRFPMSSQSAFS
jgi:hypothetical protein